MSTTHNAGANTLTEMGYWDDFWTNVRLPREAKYSESDPLLNAQLMVIDAHFAVDSSKTVLEIGGAPGGYLAYFTRRFHYKAHALDYSAAGCNTLRDNFKLLDLDVVVYQADILSSQLHLPQFDIVYSLGLIEHFKDLRQILTKHLNLVKPGGVLMIGVPYFLHSFRAILKRLAPDVFAGHNLDTLSMKNWESFESEHGLRIVFKDYIGGFHPYIMRSVINAGSKNKSAAVRWFDTVLRVYARGIRFLDRIVPIREYLLRMKGKRLSAYAIAIYEKPRS